MRSRNHLARKRLTHDSHVAELERDLNAAQHLLHEIVICAFRREHGRDPISRAEYRAYHRKLYDEAVATMEARTEAPDRAAPYLQTFGHMIPVPPGPE